jgi:hypothetical protein
MKIYIILICLLNSLTLFSQYQISATNDPNFTKSTLSDEFNNSRNSAWDNISGPSMWGQEYFTSGQIDYYSADYRYLLRLTAENWYGTVLSGGIWLRDINPSNNTHYGYYEIEARTLEGDLDEGEYSRIKPAFWLFRGNDNATPKFYEEINILEPKSTEYIEGIHQVGVHYLYDPTYDHDTTVRDTDGNLILNQQKHRVYKYEVDFTQWNKYGILWNQNHVYFFLNNEVFGEIVDNVPQHEAQNVLIDLQVAGGVVPEGILGYFDINYFHYYTLNYSTDNITENEGIGYDFTNHINEVKISCDFSQTSVNSNKIIRFKEYVVLHDEFEVNLTNNREFILMPTE